jgi:protein-L-isoaspartate(D-aspartate) O-methyltransferase
MPDFATARLNMVEGQVRPNKVVDQRVVDAMMAVPREQFVPKAARGVAYVDEDIPVAPGRYLIEPMVLGRMLQEARLAPEDIVLVIGAGTGYSAAVLSRIAATVVAVESDADLARRASATLQEQGAENAVVVEAPLADGYPKQAPYDVVIIDGAVAEVPEALLGQLAEGGRLVGVVAPDGRLGRAMLYERRGGAVAGRVLFEAGTPLLPGFSPAARFVF